MKTILILLTFSFVISTHLFAQKIVKSSSGTSNIYEYGTDVAAKIGIGTTSPTAKLHIYSSPATQTVLKVDATTTGVSPTAIGSLETWSLKNGIYYGFYQSQAGTTIPKNYLKNNLGIDVVNPLNKLDVNGVIGCTGTAATGMKINNSNQPFVIRYFTDNYQPDMGDTLMGGEGLDLPSDTATLSPLTITVNGVKVEDILECTYLVNTPAVKISSNPHTGSVFMCNDQEGNGGWSDPATFSITGGNVGIGSQSPFTKLQVNDFSEKISIGSAEGEHMQYGTGYIGFNAARGNTQWLFSTDTQNNGGGVIWSGVDGTLYFSNVGSSSNPGNNQYLSDTAVVNRIKMKICTNGDIGIGTSNVSGYKIAVNGKILCEEMKVRLKKDWPDYVFNKGYRLRPLKEVDEFIQNNNHLPDLPSAKEVTENGINVGEMNVLLLRKIEELTIYVISLQKEVEQLKTKSGSR